MKILKRLAIAIMILFYVTAGVKHFLNPAPYLTIIPPYLPFHETLNYLAGFFEIAFGLLLIPVKTRKLACWGIILMLIAFMPAHIYMIEKLSSGPYMLGKNTITPLIAWARIPFQAIFILWAYWCSKMDFNLFKLK